MISAATQARNVGAQLALAEMVRVLFAQVLMTSDRDEFHERLQNVEDVILSGMAAREILDFNDPQAEKLVRESATNLVTRVLSSIRHPDDPKLA